MTKEMSDSTPKAMQIFEDDGERIHGKCKCDPDRLGGGVCRYRSGDDHDHMGSQQNILEEWNFNKSLCKLQNNIRTIYAWYLNE